MQAQKYTNKTLRITGTERSEYRRFLVTSCCKNKEIASEGFEPPTFGL